jgi:hypothetical protein
MMLDVIKGRGTSLLLMLAALLFPTVLAAGPADVMDVQVECRYQACSFQVTVGHQDEGWEHYADRWEVLGPDNELLATRVLHHPHEYEQPFTRGMSGVEIPESIQRVRLRAHDNVHGYGGHVIEIDLPR